MLFRRCPKCGVRVLPEFFRIHQIICGKPKEFVQSFWALVTKALESIAKIRKEIIDDRIRALQTLLAFAERVSPKDVPEIGSILVKLREARGLLHKLQDGVRRAVKENIEEGMTFLESIKDAKDKTDWLLKRGVPPEVPEEYVKMFTIELVKTYKLLNEVPPMLKPVEDLVRQFLKG